MLILKPLWHDDLLCIAIQGRFSSTVAPVIKNYPGIRYSRTHSCFYLTYTPVNLQLLKDSINRLEPCEEQGWHLMDHNLHREAYLKRFVVVPREYTELLTRMRYSEATIENYSSQFRLFLIYIFPKTMAEINEPSFMSFYYT
jgi:integrase/recombinase XerD